MEFSLKYQQVFSPLLHAPCCLLSFLPRTVLPSPTTTFYFTTLHFAKKEITGLKDIWISCKNLCKLVIILKTIEVVGLIFLGCKARFKIDLKAYLFTRTLCFEIFLVDKLLKYFSNSHVLSEIYPYYTTCSITRFVHFQLKLF